jgi:alpha-tubulin suppressor-like RCC1 family protein
MADGTVRSWGYNYNGELGNGTQTHSATPVTVQTVGGGGALSGVVEVASDYGTTLAVRQDSSVVGWGYNYAGTVGDGTNVQARLLPTVVLDADTGGPLTGVAHVDVGDNTSYALMNDGTVKDWGYSRCNGQAAFTQKVRASTNPLFGDDVVQLETGYYGGAVVLLGDGTVLTCGGATPILGRPATTWQQANTPLPVTGLGAGSGVIDVTWGMETIAVLKDDGTVWMWGANNNNELTVAGVPGGSYAYAPVQVPLPPGPPVVDLEMDYSVTVHAIRADGSVLVWGGNVYDSAGNGDDDYNIVGVQPVVLPGETVAVANSVWNGLALVRPLEPGAGPVRPQYWISASVADAQVGEATGGSVEFTLSQVASTDVAVDFDFDGQSHTVTIPAGETSMLAPLAVADDTVDEDDAQLPIRITAVSNGVRTARGSGLVTVLDDDAPPTLSIADVVVAEGDTSLTDVGLTVTLSAPTSRDVVVDVATVQGTAELGTDVFPYDGSLLIPAGETAGTVHVPVVGDGLLEDDEAFTVVLSNPQLATLADDSATVTIIDDEPIVMTVTSPAVIEGDVGVTPAQFVVTATQPPTPTDVVVPWSVLAGTAEANSDVLATDGELIVTGSASEVVTVDVVADEVDEPLTVETFRLALGAVAATSGRPVIVRDLPMATITDDDDPVVPDPIPVVVDAGPDLSSTEGSSVALTGSVTGGGSSGAPLQWTVANPACTIAEPGALTTSVTCPDELTTTVTLTVSLPDGSTVADSAALDVANANPTLTVLAPVNGQQVAFGAAISPMVELGDPGPADVLACSVAWDDGTAVTSCDQPHAYAVAGPRTITITVADGDGGSAQATVGIQVLPPDPTHFEFRGFYAPVANVPAVNVIEAGSTVPLKFSLGGDHGLAIFAQGYPASASRPCNGGPTGPLEPTVLPGGATLTYDSSSRRYQYNWKTSRAWVGQCRTLVMRFVDGTEVTAEFRFKP